MLIFRNKEMFWFKMEKLLISQAVSLTKMLRLLIVQINFSFQEESILILICNFLLWGLMQWMISIQVVKLPLQEEQLPSLTSQFLLHNKQCQLLIKDGGGGQIQKSIVIMRFMPQLLVGTLKHLMKWEKWSKMESQVSNSLWHIKEFLVWMTFQCSKHLKQPEIWEPYASFMPKMVTLSLKINRNFLKKESQDHKGIISLDHNLFRHKLFIEWLLSLSTQTYQFILFTWWANKHPNNFSEPKTEDF